MANIFDLDEILAEQKEKIRQACEGTKKAIYAVTQPYGHYIWGSSSSPNRQGIYYEMDGNALLFESSGRCCLVEHVNDDGSEYYTLLGNGSYVPESTERTYAPISFSVINMKGVPDPPANKTSNWTLTELENATKTSKISAIKTSIENAVSGSGAYGLSGSLRASVEFYSERATIGTNGNFKIGYVPQYASGHAEIQSLNNPTTVCVVSKNYVPWNFTSSREVYNKALDIGYIELLKKGSSAIFDKLSPQQSYFGTSPIAAYYRFYNILITSDENQGIEYVNNGTIPDDARCTNSDGRELSLTDEDDGKESTGDKKDKFIPTTENSNPTQSQLSTGTSFFYKMTTAHLKAFITWFWNDVDLGDILFNTVTGLYNNMSECVLSVKYFPLSVGSDFFTTTEHGIVMGRFKTDENYSLINKIKGNGNLCTFDFTDYAKYDLYSSKSRPHAFADYSPYTDVVIYLPFYGFHKLDTNLVMERELTIGYSLDVTTGALDYLFKIGGCTVETLSCNFGIDVPYTLSSMLEMGTQIASQVTAVAMNAGSNLISSSDTVSPQDVSEPEVPKTSKGSSNLVGTKFTPPSMNIGGKISNGIGLYHVLQPYVIIKHPRYYRASSYGKIEGYPCMKTYKLENLKGYTECERPQIQTWTNGNPTADEIGEVLNILSDGIVIR